MNPAIVETDIPARLDRLPWSRFHTLVVAALGITWIFDGLEVTLAGALSGALKQSPVLQFSNTDIGIVGSAYLAGAVLGALFFGWLTDRLGRKKLFFITLAVYLAATAATALSWNLWTFALFRFFTGAGIGGEYAAINSTIQELVPGALSRLDGSLHQRQFLDRRRDRRRRLDHPARSGFHRSGIRLAARVLDWGRARAHHLCDAVLDSGKPALADDAWPRRGSRAYRRRYRSAIGSRTSERNDAARAIAAAPGHADRGGLAHAVSHLSSASDSSVSL